MQRTLLAVSLAAATLFGAARAEAKVHVVTTIQTFKSLAEEVGGDKVEVSALVGDAVDPHFNDARPSYAVLLNRADLLVYVGLELEKGWLPPLLEQSRNPNIQIGQPGNLDASKSGISIQDVGLGTSRTQGDVHPLGNPHYHLPPENALAVARSIRDRLKALDPGDGKAFDDGLANFERKLTAKRKEWEAKAKALVGVKVVTYHKSWSYFDAWLGLQEIGYVEPKPGIPPDPQHLAQLVTDAKTQGAKILIMESYYPRNTAQRVADLSGMKLAVLSSDVLSGQSYFALIDGLLDQLVKSL
jgi:zinc/manganese transport system substrate-binding protein